MRVCQLMWVWARKPHTFLSFVQNSETKDVHTNKHWIQRGKNFSRRIETYCNVVNKLMMQHVHSFFSLAPKTHQIKKIHTKTIFFVVSSLIGVLSLPLHCTQCKTVTECIHNTHTPCVYKFCPIQQLQITITIMYCHKIYVF